MKRLIFIIALFYLSIPLLHAQKGNNINFIKGPERVVYIDNSYLTWVTIEFEGDSLKGSSVPNSYEIGGENYQIIKYRYPVTQYGNTSSTEKEIELLKYYMDYELDYLQDSVFEKQVKSDHEIFLNTSGKRFLLWKYKMPKVDVKDAPEITDFVEWHLFLSCVCNGYVCGVNIQSYESDKIDEKIAKIKAVAERFSIYGSEIDTDALWYMIDARKDTSDMQLTDTLKNYELDIPKWANICKTNAENFWIATLPNIDNVKNAVTLKSFDKADYDSFEAFNKKHITGITIGDKTGKSGTWILRKELEKPANCNGVSYKVDIMNGKMLYQCQYVTFYSKSTYFLLTFFSTEKTYTANVGKFNEFINGFRVFN
ncbi:MAG: hypothetical protein GQ574_03410 [Crocinitomix sp.]|nr:hypothetical protein [Crocinitomix sp.]